MSSLSEYGFSSHSGGYIISDEEQSSGAGRQKKVDQKYKLMFTGTQEVQLENPGIKIKGMGYINGFASIANGGPESSASSNIEVCEQSYLGNSASVYMMTLDSEYEDSKEEWVSGEATVEWITTYTLGVPTGAIPVWKGYISWSEYAGCNGWRAYSPSEESTTTYEAMAEVGYKNQQISTDL
jgi:hypothetical protein